MSKVNLERFEKWLTKNELASGDRDQIQPYANSIVATLRIPSREIGGLDGRFGPGTDTGFRITLTIGESEILITTSTAPMFWVECSQIARACLISQIHEMLLVGKAEMASDGSVTFCSPALADIAGDLGVSP